jgi:hypothetical protein
MKANRYLWCGMCVSFGESSVTVRVGQAQPTAFW